MKKDKLYFMIFAVALSIMISTSQMIVVQAEEEKKADVSVIINTDSEQTAISPYIYGVNDGVTLKYTKVGAIRLGGNRTSAYNWENNLSNAGSDYFFSTDNYMIDSIREEYKNVSGGAALDIIADTKEYDVPYALLTLQMLGYVANGNRQLVPESKTAPNTDYWAKVLNHKESEYCLNPNTDDNVVYMDEYLNYLIHTVGDSQNGGFKGYALDNEPSLWSSTHKLIQTEPLTCKQLIEKTIDLASVVKQMDPNADVFGPALYGYMAYLNFQNASDWNTIKLNGEYDWFIEYYLDEMKQAEKEKNIRLVDVLDLHYYTEARGECGERRCADTTDECIKNRIDSIRSMWDSEYKEDSWIMDTGAKFFPLLPNVQKSIDSYYPETKIGFTEYDFGGGGHISGGIAEVDFLGICAEYGVYYATLWSFDHNAFQLGAINMFTNYDRNGTGFGDMLITEVESSDDYTVSAYAAYTSTENDGTIRLILTNKNVHENTTVSLSLEGKTSYEVVEKYVLEGKIAGINRDYDYDDCFVNNKLTLTLSPLSVTELVIKAKSIMNETQIDIETAAISQDIQRDNLFQIILISSICIGSLIVIGGIVTLFKRKKHQYKKGLHE